MLGMVCVGCLIEKTRSLVPHGGLTWEVDVYGGTLAGLVLAQVELGHEDQPYAKPGWVGQEVSGEEQKQSSCR